MMIFDQSGSMAKATSDTDSTPRIDSAKKAATASLDIPRKELPATSRSQPDNY